MHVTDLQHDAIDSRARVIFRFKKPHPLVVGVVVDNVHALAEAV
jgi:hypothetical protein